MQFGTRNRCAQLNVRRLRMRSRTIQKPLSSDLLRRRRWCWAAASEPILSTIYFAIAHYSNAQACTYNLIILNKKEYMIAVM